MREFSSRADLLAGLGSNQNASISIEDATASDWTEAISDVEPVDDPITDSTTVYYGGEVNGLLYSILDVSGTTCPFAISPDGRHWAKFNGPNLGGDAGAGSRGLNLVYNGTKYYYTVTTITADTVAVYSSSDLRVWSEENISGLTDPLTIAYADPVTGAMFAICEAGLYSVTSDLTATPTLLQADAVTLGNFNYAFPQPKGIKIGSNLLFNFYNSTVLSTDDGATWSSTTDISGVGAAVELDGRTYINAGAGLFSTTDFATFTNHGTFGRGLASDGKALYSIGSTKINKLIGDYIYQTGGDLTSLGLPNARMLGHKDGHFAIHCDVTNKIFYL